MKHAIFYIFFPIAVFLFHFLYLKFVLLIRDNKFLVVFANTLLYPLLGSALVSAFFCGFLNKSHEHFFSSLIFGVIFYYISLVAAFFPFIGIIFGELDIEFLFIGMGCALGMAHPIFHTKFYNILLAINWIPLLVVFVVSFIVSALVKQVITGSITGVEHSEKEALNILTLSICVSTGIVSAILIVLVYK